jgi:hypothetical protein
MLYVRAAEQALQRAMCMEPSTIMPEASGLCLRSTTSMRCAVVCCLVMRSWLCCGMGVCVQFLRSALASDACVDVLLLAHHYHCSQLQAEAVSNC